MMKTTLIVVLSCISIVLGQDYCSAPYTDYCKLSGPHIGCPASAAALTKKVSSFYPIDFSKYQTMFLNAFNKYRNDTAGGIVNGLPTASGLRVTVSFFFK